MVLDICKHFLPDCQWRLLTEDLQKESCAGEAEDDSAHYSIFPAVSNGVFVDPSVRFFGIDWEAIFGRCFSLSLNAKIFSDKVVDIPSPSCNGDKHPDNLDLVLTNRILRDLTLLEADVTSHAEAVLQGRLSKLNRMLIQKEQLKYSSSPIDSPTTEANPKLPKKVSKAQSFRDAMKTVAGSPKPRPPMKYKKNKTTHLDKLFTPLNDFPPAHHNHHHQHQQPHSNQNNGEEQHKLIADIHATTNDVLTTSDELLSELKKKKKSFIHNISSILRITGDTMK